MIASKIQRGVNIVTYKNVYAAYPAYRDGKGNGTEYMTKNGVEWIDQCFTTFKKHWAEECGVVWQQAVKESVDTLEQKHIRVVMLTEDRCLVPVKTRIPICKDDGAYGYLWDEKIHSLQATENGTKVVLKNGEEVKTYTHIDTVKKYRRMVRFLKDEHELKKRKQKIKQVIIYE